MNRKALDKFYTSDTAASTFIQFIQNHVDIDSFDNIIEPSAGAGALLNHLPSRAIGVDLMPERDDIIKSDFFDFTYPTTGRTITVGNPPFGNRSKLAIDFFNRAAEHSEVVAFIIPVTWEKFSIHKQLAAGWALRASERLPEKSFVLGDKPYAVRCCMQVWVRGELPEQRQMSKVLGVHPDFSFVSKDADWDFCMSSSPCIVRSREYFVEKDGAFCSHFIKSHVPDLEETFNTIAWQSSEAKQFLSGSRFPVADTVDVVKVYELFKEGKVPSKKGDWRVQKERAKVRKHHDYRKTEKEPGTHPDFIISSRYNPNAEFVIRGVRPKVSDDINIYDTISDNTRYYSVQPLVPGVREVFDKIEWSSYWQGVSMPTVSIPDCVEAYIQNI